jgi:DNA recombination protein RmuC
MEGLLIGILIGFLSGCLVAWLILKARVGKSSEKVAEENKSNLALITEERTNRIGLEQRVLHQETLLEDRKNSLERALSEAEKLKTQLNETISKCASAETRNARIPELSTELEQVKAEAQKLSVSNSDLNAQLAQLKTQLSEERKSIEEKFALLQEAEKKFSDSFKALSADALKSNNQSFIELAKSNFETFQAGAAHDLEIRQKSINELVQPLKVSLENVDKKVQELESARKETYGRLDEQLKNVAQLQSTLQCETQNLVQALRKPTVRGRWGEVQLRNVVEIAGMVNHCDFSQQVDVNSEEGKLRPDMVVRLPGGKTVVVDSKSTMDAYLSAVNAPNEEARSQFLKEHVQQVRNQVAKLSSKTYWAQFEHSPEFVVLFLPGEMLFSAALELDPNLIEDSARERVIIATPTTLIALLRAVAFGWTQERLSQNAQAISALGRDLYDRVRIFSGHITDMGRSLDKSVGSFNKAVGSFESRVLVSARKFKDLGACDGQEIDLVEPIEITARVIQAPELAVANTLEDLQEVN